MTINDDYPILSNPMSNINSNTTAAYTHGCPNILNFMLLSTYTVKRGLWENDLFHLGFTVTDHCLYISSLLGFSFTSYSCTLVCPPTTDAIAAISNTICLKLPYSSVNRQLILMT